MGEQFPTPAGPSTGATILAAVKGRIAPARPSLMYLLALFMVAVLMLLLPLIYLAVIVAILYAVYWHAVNDAQILQQIRGFSSMLIFYVGPMVCGVMAVLFMVKPLFVRRRLSEGTIKVRREDEPLLYAYVDQLCGLVGCKPPRWINVDCNVNAAAGFIGAGGLLTGDLALTLGLPLAGGMDLRLFSGVLAHELGHFSQGSGMRVSYVIRMIDSWLAQAVFQRDAWDTALVNATRRGHVIIRLVAFFCLGMVWLTRRLLWGLTWIGSATSAFMLRQMEFDADRYESRVAGSDALEQSFGRIILIGMGHQAAMSELAAGWRERRLPDDLPALIGQREMALGQEVRQAMAERLKQGRTRLFDSHPCERDRVARARRDAEPGVLKLELPAAALFKDFKELCCLATMRYYQQVLGRNLRAEHVYATQAMAEKHDAKQQSFQSLFRYFQQLISPLYPPPIFEVSDIPADPDERAALIVAARTELAATAGECAGQLNALQNATQTLDRMLAVRSLRAAQVKLDLKTYGLSTGNEEELAAAEAAARAEIDSARQNCAANLTVQARRLVAALAFTAPPRRATPAEPEEATGEYLVDEQAGSDPNSVLWESLRSMWHCQASVDRLRQRYSQLQAVLSFVRPHGNSRPLVGEAMSASKRAYRELQAVHEVLRKTPYPYEHTERGATISRFCCAQFPGPNRIGDIAVAAEATLKGYFHLYLRLLSDLASAAEEVEKSIGLPPLEEPS